MCDKLYLMTVCHIQKKTWEQPHDTISRGSNKNNRNKEKTFPWNHINVLSLHDYRPTCGNLGFHLPFPLHISFDPNPQYVLEWLWGEGSISSFFAWDELECPWVGVDYIPSSSHTTKPKKKFIHKSKYIKLNIYFAKLSKI